MNRRLFILASLSVLAPVAVVHCNARLEPTSVFESGVNEETDGGGGGEGGATSGGVDQPTDLGGDCDEAGTCMDVAPRPKSTCGDGTLGEGEACDDGNLKGGDGCSAVCVTEPGWACPTAGLRCEAAQCGDGILVGAEECEHPVGTKVTGCSATCKIEPKYDCDPIALTCAQTVCGDGKVSRGESCEDGNDVPFDGCYKCQKEPACTNGVCQPLCGDGQRFAAEACDDGNTRDGDGCSSTCALEPGYGCTDVIAAPPPKIDLPVIMRDFIGTGLQTNGGVGHDDFNGLGGGGILGITETTLGPNGRPVFRCPNGDCTQNPGRLGGSGRHANMTTKENFAQWYTNVAGINITVPITVPLARNATTGTYSWDSADPAVNGGFTFFDPLHSKGWVAANKEVLTCSPSRNCSFTSETQFWFEYQGGERFDFSGDDDTWVFVNNKLAIDLGGLHGQLSGYFILDADTDGPGADTADGTASATSSLEATHKIDLGLVRGGVYNVVMFQAERNACGSNFHVTLKDFNRPKSSCASTCGDGVTASDEACDDGVNDGTYGRCMPGCKTRGPRCGDGNLDAPQEECDDGNTTNNDDCTNACTKRRVQ